MRRGLAGPLLSAAALVLGLGACTFEERGNANGDGTSERAVSLEEAVLDSGRDTASAVLDVVRTFREATANGDLSLALALTDRDASFADDLVGGLDEGHTRGELLLELRRKLAGGLNLREEATEVILGEGLAVVHSRLMLEGADSDGGEDAAVRETVVLVPVAEGWRIRHLHRSIPMHR